MSHWSSCPPWKVNCLDIVAYCKSAYSFNIFIHIVPVARLNDFRSLKSSNLEELKLFMQNTRVMKKLPFCQKVDSRARKSDSTESLYFCCTSREILKKKDKKK